MTPNEFVNRREHDWVRLEALTHKNRGRNTLTAEEIHELGQLYRAVASDLAIARRDYPNASVTRFLNQLLTRTHSFIYQQDVSNAQGFIHYLTHVIPQIFRQTWHFTFIAFLLFLLPAVVGFRLGFVNPSIAQSLGLEAQRAELANESIWTDISPEERPAAMSLIATNNIRVSILAFSGGMSLGIFTVYITTFNGLIIGTILGLAYHYGLGYELTNFIVAHGFIELTVIFISAGAGMQVGWAILHPGPYSWRDSVATTARRIVPLIALCVFLLVVAGAIEGFLSPSGAPFGVKLATGTGTWILLASYLLWTGRAPQKMQG